VRDGYSGTGAHAGVGDASGGFCNRTVSVISTFGFDSFVSDSRNPLISDEH